MRRRDDKFIRFMYIQNENKRAETLNRLKNARNAIVNTCNGGNIRLSASQLSKFTNFRKNISQINNSIDLVRQHRKGIGLLNPEIVRNEKTRAATIAVKELYNIIGKAKNDYDYDIKQKDFYLIHANKRFHTNNDSVQNSIKRKLNLNQTEMKYRNFIENIIKKKEEKINKRMIKEKTLIEKWKASQEKLKLNKLVLGDFKNERSKEKRKFIERREEYKRNIILEKIKEEEQRSLSLQETKVGINKLRQEMRKNTAYSKYLVKQKLEKLGSKLYSVQDFDKAKAMEKIFEKTELKNLYKNFTGNKPSSEMNFY